VNFSAYDGVESLAQYSTPAALAAYRGERISRYARHVDFFRTLGIPAGGLRVVEIGSGSSAFLYALEESGMLAAGVGIELSQSRHEFAERWRTDAGYRRVTNVRGDFAAASLEGASFDRFVVIDDTLLLLRPENPSYPTQLTASAHRLLNQNGRFVAAFRNEARAASQLPRDGRSFWVELPDTNAFRYALYRQEFQPSSETVLNESIYLARDGRESRKVEVTDARDVSALVEVLRAAGFRRVLTYGDLSMTPFSQQNSDRVVVVGEK
jgi:SAM-dependent methyltransferase